APLTLGREKERMVVKLKPVLDGSAVHLRGNPACVDQRIGFPPEAIARRGNFGGCLARCRPFAARHINADVPFRAAQSFLERSAYRGGETARVPIESEHASKRLEPVRIGQSSQRLAAAEFAHQENHDLARQRNHAFEQVTRSSSAVKRQVGKTGSGHGQAVNNGGQSALARNGSRPFSYPDKSTILFSGSRANVLFSKT